MKCRGMTVDERDAYLEILTRLSKDADWWDDLRMRVKSRIGCRFPWNV